MNHILLLGAGFSRNWGGFLATEVFDYLLSIPTIADDPYLRETLWRCGDFESALAAVRTDAARDAQRHPGRVGLFHEALERMFAEMNNALWQREFEFQDDQQRLTRSDQHLVRTFLSKFDAIFTLNQDLLLEHAYLDPDLYPTGNVGGAELPGMSLRSTNGPSRWAKGTWEPKQNQADFVLADGCQPYFKLHGSSNWTDRFGGPMLIMGGNKTSDLELHPILCWYREQFDKFLNKPNTRLMVIGYGFADRHINTALERAIKESDLRIFVIDPLGSGVVQKFLNVPSGMAGSKLSDFGLMFQRSLIGASRRELSATFSYDRVEFAKVERFFNL